MNNFDLSHNVISELIQFGVREFVLCAGARNSPFVIYLDEFKDEIEVFNFFEERSAAFFALGRIVQSQRPVAIITTSGTAAAELLPAAIEATYSGLPLILITADRPKRFRRTGAPQSIEQIGLFSHYVESDFDLNINQSLHHHQLSVLSWKKPIHLNVCFDEPLIDGKISQEQKSQIIQSLKKNQDPLIEWGQKEVSLPFEDLKLIREFLRSRRPLVILGPIGSLHRSSVRQFLEKYQRPIYAESLSGLRGEPSLMAQTIKSGEPFIKQLFENNKFDSILRIGNVPTVRIWRDLEDKLVKLPVLSISDNNYSGLSRPSYHFNCIDQLSFFMDDTLNEDDALNETGLSSKVFDFFEQDSLYYQRLSNLFLEFPLAEPSLVHSLSLTIKDSSVYLGNSLPIREWDLAASFNYSPQRVFGNRGANGIDGQLSTFLGWSDSQQENWGVFGDLTTMYDLSAPWVTHQMDSMKCRIVIINNLGGQIFKRMFKRDSFINPHQIEFSHWAHFWKWDYQYWKHIPKNPELSLRQIIEISPSPEETNLFWKKHQEIFD